jgi:hypothetical protein
MAALRRTGGAHRLGSGKLLGLRLQQPGINPQSRAKMMGTEIISAKAGPGAKARP